jgi:demethylmenaquinone methyltransferase/2-methoxy-6-polyprenyl-1,4-benzoquinol methylase
MSERETDFGYQRVPEHEKAARVRGVFDSVASRYDLMNDLMSLGLHRLWKRLAVLLAGARPGNRVLDLAGGSGDLTRLLARDVGPTGEVVILDINRSMLEVGRDRLLDAGLAQNVRYTQANAEALPFGSNTFDLVVIGFGLRNVTRKDLALAEMNRVLKPGGRAFVLEFSQVSQPLLARLYDLYSFKLLPRMGKLFANDEASYRYLAESIRMHPPQAELAGMMRTAGFGQCQYVNMLGGVVALHGGVKL